MTKIFILAATLWAQSSFAVECPNRAGEDTLSLSQVMYHWGKASRVIGTVANNGLHDPGSVTKVQLQEAFDLVEIARACSSRILAGDPVMPAKLMDIAREFSDNLDGIGTICESLLAGPSQYDFKQLKERERLMIELANRAHGSL
jgi:hypothetical protein